MVDVGRDGEYNETNGDVANLKRIVGFTVVTTFGGGDHHEENISARDKYHHTDDFDEGADVYTYLNPEARDNGYKKYDVYVCEDRDDWTDGIDITDLDVTGRVESHTPRNDCDNGWVVLAWDYAECGIYDIILDISRDKNEDPNGIYDRGEDLIDRVEITGFSVSTATELFRDDVEDEDTKGWIYNEFEWEITTEDYHSGSHSWKAEPKEGTSSLTSQKIPLLTRSGPRLYFWIKYDFEEGDTVKVEIDEDDDNDWDTLCTYPEEGDPPSSDWAEKMFDLEDYTEHFIRIRFSVESQGDYTHLYIDDIEVKAARVMADDWTFAVYMSGENLDTEAVADFNEMEIIGSDENINVVIRLDRASEGEWSDTRDYVVIEDEDDEEIDSFRAVNRGEKNMGTNESLEQFMQWTKTNYPAERYALVLYGEGDGIYGVCKDGNDFINLSELKEALNTITNEGDEPLDLLWFYNSRVGLTEIMYELVGSNGPMIDYIVASETDVSMGDECDEDGEFKKIIRRLIDKHRRDASYIAKKIVEYYYETWRSNGDVSIASIDMDNFEDSGLVEHVDNLSKAILAAYGNETYREYYKAEIDNATEYADRYPDENGTTIDLYYFAKYLEEELGKKDPDDPYYDEIKDWAEEIRDDFYDVVDEWEENMDASRGLAIYFPKSAGDYDAEYRNLGMSEDYDNWYKFVEEHLDV